MTPSSACIDRHWPLDRVIVGPILQRYPTRATVAVDTAQGRFVAKLYANEVALGLVEPSTAKIERSLDVFGYLERNDFGHAPRPLSTSEGRSFARVEQDRLSPRTHRWKPRLGRSAARITR